MFFLFYFLLFQRKKKYFDSSALPFTFLDMKYHARSCLSDLTLLVVFSFEKRPRFERKTGRQASSRDRTGIN